MISSYGCDHMTADAECLLSKAKYKAATGREQLCCAIRFASPSSPGRSRRRRPTASAMKLIDHIEVYHAEKQDGITNQRVDIHYNCIGTFDVPNRRKIPETDIIMETRKGVALSYAPEQVAV